MADALVLGASTERCRGSSPLSCNFAAKKDLFLSENPNDHGPMTNKIPTTKTQKEVHLDFGIWCFIDHCSLVIFL